ncbi:hypothetical protein [Streptomyces lavendulae]|uniref:hypothetical protein n=1 Tax=Streptomyces lavendulae TaxID=1914 RepID=UPI0024A569F1|nr:hypothetical protein [Streptomyces lavendulae]GLX19564.1 hypothetical protein Slala01_32080 [Streptomyces lavendulae subsp. lavendulae]GLX27059.1 hypothetical protein Slala02_28790 [Streptomyces lavendulae subsp. lavendulae]
MEQRDGYGGYGRYGGQGRQPGGWAPAGRTAAPPYGRPSADRERTRRHGCVTVLMAPFVAAARFQRPGRADRLADPAMSRAQVARTGIGLGATAWLFYAYTLRQGAKDVIDDKLTEMLLAAAVLMVVGPLAVGAFVVAARPPLRGRYRRRLPGPLTAFGVLFGAAALLAFAFRRDLHDRLFGGIGDVGFLLSLLIGLTSLFLLPFVLASSVLCVHHSFRTADVHEVLPPLLSPVVVVAMSVLQAVDGPPVNAPQSVWLLFLAGAPLSVTALSVWELHRLRTRYGITLRGALGR